MMKSKRSKACDISQKVKLAVWERDNHRCVFCGSTYAMPNAHIVSRAKSGLGVEKNIITLCLNCHEKMDHSSDRENSIEKAKAYITKKYGYFDEKEVTYDKNNS